MKRSKALLQIKQAGYDNDTSKAAFITAQAGLGKAASRKAFLDGQKARDRGEPRPEQMISGNASKRVQSAVSVPMGES